MCLIFFPLKTKERQRNTYSESRKNEIQQAGWEWWQRGRRWPCSDFTSVSSWAQYSAMALGSPFHPECRPLLHPVHLGLSPWGEGTHCSHASSRAASSLISRLLARTPLLPTVCPVYFTSLCPHECYSHVGRAATGFSNCLWALRPPSVLSEVCFL